MKSLACTHNKTFDMAQPHCSSSANFNASCNSSSRVGSSATADPVTSSHGLPVGWTSAYVGEPHEGMAYCSLSRSETVPAWTDQAMLLRVPTMRPHLIRKHRFLLWLSEVWKENGSVRTSMTIHALSRQILSSTPDSTASSASCSGRLADNEPHSTVYHLFS